jgi:preprotein translocase subunit Sss1
MDAVALEQLIESLVLTGLGLLIIGAIFYTVWGHR